MHLKTTRQRESTTRLPATKNTTPCHASCVHTPDEKVLPETTPPRPHLDSRYAESHADDDKILPARHATSA
ncbi:hypothetical protein BDZ85DRAFT_255436 [Elsinoe ampelina]|uniref:Uncharacterized protein n=1 Tax=Elsinoe ampelina TaxID=302913 RepID=A0A6A6GR00_9PEZI|nr:hypothetical protein BDZ85DRAFT_255436 [Elsinoe ampelina]